MPIYAQSSTLRTLLIPLVDVDQTTLQDEDLLQYNATTGKFENQPLSSGGVSVITTASNLGAGTGLFAQKNTYDLQFKSLIAGDNVTITNDASTITIAAAAETNTAYSYQFGLTFDGNGDVDTITDVPAGWTITRIGNIVTVQHTVNRYPKSISYWGKDSVNGWQYRLPTAGYQALIDAGDELINFQIDVNATAAGADASSEAKVNVIF